MLTEWAQAIEDELAAYNGSRILSLPTDYPMPANSSYSRTEGLTAGLWSEAGTSVESRTIELAVSSICNFFVPSEANTLSLCTVSSACIFKIA